MVMTTRTIDSTRPLLVFGGPYSNLQATRAMRREAETHSITPSHIICTGDVVAYAADPEETAREIRDWGIHVIAGNCEEQLADNAGDCGCGFEEGSVCDTLSRGWYPYALQKTSAEIKGWMAGLPKYLTFRYCGLRFRVLHGGGRETNRFVFASDRAALADEVEEADADVVIAGHAGLPFVTEFNETAWINPGVIGMPANDGTPDGWFGLIQAERDGISVSLHRLAYDYAAAAGAMRRSGHANGYARTLITGIWPSHDILPPAELEQTGRPLGESTARIRGRLGVTA